MLLCARPRWQPLFQACKMARSSLFLCCSAILKGSFVFGCVEALLVSKKSVLFLFFMGPMVFDELVKDLTTTLFFCLRGFTLS